MTRIFTRAYVCGADLKPEEVKRKLLGANKGAMVQTSGPDAADNEFLIELLAAQTLKAQALRSLLAKKPEIDFLLRLAGTTQIAKAIRQVGARQGGRFLAVVAAESEVKEVKGLPGLRLPRRELTRSELGRVERAALLNAKRP